MAWHVPSVPQRPEQHRPLDVQGAPEGAHAGTTEPQLGGLPTQLPLAHSKPAWQLTPSARSGDVQTRRPVPSSVHAPWQQSVSCSQTVPIARQALPVSGSQRFTESSHAPQHGAPPPEVQSSPDGRHVATGSSAHLLPCAASQ